MISDKKRRLVYERDGFRCAAEGPHCQRFTNLTIQHRINRGMGGSKRRDSLSNLLTLCAACNGLLESDAEFAERGRDQGWKLYSWEIPTMVPLFVTWSRQWLLLNDEGESYPASRLVG